MRGDADGKCTDGKLTTLALTIGANGLTNDGNSFQTGVSKNYVKQRKIDGIRN